MVLSAEARTVCDLRLDSPRPGSSGFFFASSQTVHVSIEAVAFANNTWI
jgi:hypothetical protein